MEVAPDAHAALAGLERTIETCGLAPSLVELVKVRASQINACAFCRNMHTHDARKHGELWNRMMVGLRGQPAMDRAGPPRGDQAKAA